MSLRLTRRLRFLWGQALSEYVPPHHPLSGLASGHALHRYSVSGAAPLSLAGSPQPLERLSDAAVRAYVHSADWLPSSAPAELVLNSNESTTLHSIPAVSPEDVRLVTRHLLTTASTDAMSGENTKSGEVLTAHADSGRAVTLSCSTPARQDGGLLHVPQHPITAQLRSLACLLTEHRRLLAGAESLQTGVPIAAVMTELDEAALYLTWSLASHGSSAEPTLQAASKGTKLDTSTATQGINHSDALWGDSAESDLRQCFEQEVAHLHCSTHRTPEAEAVPAVVSPVAGTPKDAVVAAAVSLVTVMTSTSSALAAALKATALAWAVLDDAPTHPHFRQCGGTSAKLRHVVHAAEVLWRPAPGTALVASWWATLLHQQHQHTHSPQTRAAASLSLPTSFSSNGADGVQPTAASDQAAGAMSCAGTHAVSQGPAATSASHAAASALTPCRGGAAQGCRFHVLITGGDTTAHFVAPWVAGLCDGTARLGKTAAAPSTARGHADQQSRPSMLLCYGCPASQVEEVRAICAAACAPRCGDQRGAACGAAGTCRTEHLHKRPSEMGPPSVRTGSETPRQLVSVEVVELHTAHPTGVLLRASPSRDPAVRTPQESLPLTLTAFPLVGQAAAAPAPRPTPFAMTVADAAAHVFCGAVLERPLRCRSRHSRRRTAAASTVPGCALTLEGWSSICFAPQSHTPVLLRCLARDHFRQPVHAGHSLDAGSRRGPVPSPAHAQALQEALRHAVRGTGGGEDTGSARDDGVTRQGKCASGQYTPSRGTHADAERWVKPEVSGTLASAHPGLVTDHVVRWRHVCGGFPIPLTATASHASPYVMPSLLFVGLADIPAGMQGPREGAEVRLDVDHHGGRRGLNTAPTPPTSAAVTECDVTSVPRTHERRAPLSSSGSATREAPEADETEHVSTHIARAVAAVKASVSTLMREHDTEWLGYRGVVAGNSLFVCSYPDAWQAAVEAALHGEARGPLAAGPDQLGPPHV